MFSAHAKEKNAKLPALTSVKLALNWVPEPEFGGFYAAEQSGIYKNSNLRVDLLPGGAGSPVVQMIAAGKVEFGISSADDVIIARSKGADVVALFAVYQTSPTGIMVHASRGLKSIGDVFSSGTVAIQKGYPFYDFLRKKYKTEGAKIVPYKGGITEFLNDKNFAQQCFVTAEPAMARKKGANPQVFMVAEAGFNPYTSVLVTSGKYLKKNPEIVKAMVKASYDGWKLYLAAPQPANQWMSTLNKAMDLETFNEVAYMQTSLIVTDESRKGGVGAMTEKRWNDMAAALVDLKIIREAQPAKNYFINF
ncbi:MAG: ABC transporter substrate-binding protein [Deltaproteobacteria bacterium]|nr:ABC transporter substrate-binding protein [Deltaproteobacteria bacterium]